MNNLIIHAIPSELLPLYIFVSCAAVTIWFSKGLLNPFIDAVGAITRCAIESTLTVFFWPINAINKTIDKRIRLPIQKFHKRIPPWIVTCWYLLLGISIFGLDQIWGTRIFNVDETTPFYPIDIMKKQYWISFYAITFGGWFMLLVVLRVLGSILSWTVRLLDKNFKLNILIYR